MKYIGAHVSASGGVENAPLNAKEIGAKAFALFTKNQRQWNAAPLSKKSIEQFGINCELAGIESKHILAHNSYLTNMGNPDEEARLKSINAFTDEMSRCQELGIPLLNFHPGSHLNKISEEECLNHIIRGIDQALENTDGVKAVIENTAGQGSNLGFKFEHLAYIIQGVKDPSRIGVCIDTAHTLAAGYEIRTAEGYMQTMDSFDKIVGMKYLCGIHLNDSKKELGTRVDRHEVIGKGVMGNKLFELLMADERMNAIPIILETPDPTLWAEEIKYLYSLPGAR